MNKKQEITEILMGTIGIVICGAGIFLAIAASIVLLYLITTGISLLGLYAFYILGGIVFIVIPIIVILTDKTNDKNKKINKSVVLGIASIIITSLAGYYFEYIK